MKKTLFALAFLIAAGFMGASRSIATSQKPTPTPAHQEEPPPRDAVFYRNLSWSPDGSHLAICAMKNSKWNIYVMQADGSQVTKLTSGDGTYLSPSWSPDGRRIAFSAKQGKDSKSDIYVMNTDGSEVHQLTTHPAHDSAPAWSPDGKRIAFISDRDGKDHEVQIYEMKTDGSRQTRLRKSETHDYDPEWSPDSKQIVYYAEKGDRKDQVWLMNADGSEPTLLTGGLRHNIFPSWSPDGKSILFTSRPDGSGNDYAITTMKPDGSNLKRVSENEAFLARFSPNGARIAFLTGGYPRNAIYVMNADGSGLKKLTPW